MNFQEYALWTDKLWSNIGDSNEHALLGMFGELGEIADCKKKTFYGREVDVHNLKEEAGDFMYYAARIYRQNCIARDIKVYDLNVPITTAHLIKTMEGLCHITLVIENPFEVEKEKHVARLIGELISAVLGFCKGYGLTYDDIIACNVAKLEARYNKGKFDAEDATTNRDKANERKIIEKSGSRAGDGDSC